MMYFHVPVLVSGCHSLYSCDLSGKWVCTSQFSEPCRVHAYLRKDVLLVAS
jgi:hypothetical protein